MPAALNGCIDVRSGPCRASIAVIHRDDRAAPMCDGRVRRDPESLGLGDVRGLQAFRALRDLELNPLPLLQRAETAAADAFSASLVVPLGVK